MKVEIGNATMYLGDCREVMPSLPPVDAIVTDPVWPNVPQMNAAGTTYFLRGGDRPKELLMEALAVAPAAKRLVIVMRADSDPRFLTAVPERWPFFMAQVLPYAVPSYIGRKLGGTELAYGFGEPIPHRPGQKVISGIAPRSQPSDRRDNGHPCSRSIRHFDFLTRWWSEPDEIILDPFMGSGTTGDAAVRQGRRFVGIEIEPGYFDIACRRVEQAQKQQRLFA